jgi:diguanylate cyclase (GGDEF)-like protein
VWAKRSNPSIGDIRPARHWLPGGVGLLLLAISYCAAAIQPGEAAKLLLRADSVKTSDPPGFTTLLHTLVAEAADLSPPQQEFVRYLQAWKHAYDGEYDLAISGFQATIRETHDVTLKFRAHASIVNVLIVGSHLEEAFTQLTQLLVLLPQVTDGAAREQGLVVAAQLYNDVGQTNLAINFAQKLIEENWHGRGLCKGSDLKLRAEVLSGRVQAVGPEFNAAVEACSRLNELGYANFIRTYAAEVYLAHSQVDDAIRLLTEHYAEAQQTGYRRLISTYNAALAQAYRKRGDAERAQQFALATISSAVPNEFTEPLVKANRILYELAKERSDYKAALEYHEKYAAADKGYLDIATARQLAFQRVAHESFANELQIETLHRENRVLQLEHTLGAKAVENSRLYIMLLLMTIGFIALWAYRTKRLQLHFMSLSQVDGLTGISNRPHFIKQAQDTLESAAKAGQPSCIILCDLDHFKAVNDKYGHAAGDLVLKQTVTECQHYLRSTDIFGRFGGEEFAFLLSGCGMEDARLRAEQLRRTIAGISANGAADSNVSASFGIAATGSSGYELRQLLAHADSALYAAKRTGRNRVALYDADVKIISTGTTGTNPVIPGIPGSTGPCPSPSGAPGAEPAGDQEMTAARILGVTGS